MARINWHELWLDNLSPPFGWRRRWTFSRNRMGFISNPMIFLYLFLPHLGMAWGMVGLGLVLLLGWPFGLKFGDIPNAMGFVFIPFGAIFCVFLTPLILGRKAVMLNRTKNEALQSGGIGLLFLPILPLARKRRPLRDFKKVTLSEEPRRSNKSSYSVFAIRLQGENSESFLVVEASSELRARNLAEEVAAFTGLPMEDTTGNDPLLKDADKLDEPLGERALRTGLAVNLPSPPKRLVATYGQEDGSLQVTIARPPFNASLSLKSLLLCAVLAAACYHYLPKYPEHPYLHAPVEGNIEDLPSLWPYRIEASAYYIVHGGMYLSAVCAGISMLVLIFQEATRPYGYRIRAGAGGLEVRRSWLIFRRRFSFTRTALEDLRLEQGPGGEGHRLAAISDRRILRFAESLPKDELAYLRKLIIHAQTATFEPGWQPANVTPA